ncbi:hypothetical protein VKT23_009670 [Stygiomarasmius scandens]|uniref:HNH nuclease domain-containing protein n=1 Tax=Marasmiellus scandens TaxID=2682957 RepID=A0ABR1JGD7_9AGAR
MKHATPPRPRRATTSRNKSLYESPATPIQAGVNLRRASSRDQHSYHFPLSKAADVAPVLHNAKPLTEKEKEAVRNIAVMRDICSITCMRGKLNEGNDIEYAHVVPRAWSNSETKMGIIAHLLGIWDFNINTCYNIITLQSSLHTWLDAGQCVLLPQDEHLQDTIVALMIKNWENISVETILSEDTRKDVFQEYNSLPTEYRLIPINMAEHRHIWRQRVVQNTKEGSPANDFVPHVSGDHQEFRYPYTGLSPFKLHINPALAIINAVYTFQKLQNDNKVFTVPENLRLLGLKFKTQDWFSEDASAPSAFFDAREIVSQQKWEVEHPISSSGSDSSAEKKKTQHNESQKAIRKRKGTAGNPSKATSLPHNVAPRPSRSWGGIQAPESTGQTVVLTNVKIRTPSGFDLEAFKEALHAAGMEVISDIRSMVSTVGSNNFISSLQPGSSGAVRTRGSLGSQGRQKSSAGDGSTAGSDMGVGDEYSAGSGKKRKVE